jgi:hypothetical protein
MDTAHIQARLRRDRVVNLVAQTVDGLDERGECRRNGGLVQKGHVRLATHLKHAEAHMKDAAQRGGAG